MNESTHYIIDRSEAESLLPKELNNQLMAIERAIKYKTSLDYVNESNAYDMYFGSAAEPPRPVSLDIVIQYGDSLAYSIIKNIPPRENILEDWSREARILAGEITLSHPLFHHINRLLILGEGLASVFLYPSFYEKIEYAKGQYTEAWRRTVQHVQGETGI